MNMKRLFIGAVDVGLGAGTRVVAHRRKVGYILSVRREGREGLEYSCKQC